MSKFLFSIFCFLFSLTMFAETCPHGLINDKYPGKCFLYIDENGDSICDLSQNVQSDGITINSKIENTKFDIKNADIKSEKNDIYFLKIIIPIYFIIFLITLLSLSKVGIKYIYINNMWNIIMLFSFVIIFFSSIILLLRENGIIIESKVISISQYLHNFFGIIFLLSVFAHIILKWKSILNIFKIKK